MRKKVCFVSGCILIFLFVFFNISYAFNIGTVYLSSRKNVLEKGEEIEITLSIENAKTSAFTSYIYFDDLKLEYVSGPENTNIVDNRIIFVWYDSTGGSSPKEGELAKFKFRAKENGLATFNIEGEFYNNIGQLIETNFKETQVQIGKEQTKLEKEAKEEQATNSQNNNATLQVLRLDKEGITPNFEKDINEYYLTISNEVNDIEVLVISENPNATVEITGNTNLKEGLNLITIRVTSEDKKQNNIYTIQVTKTDNLQLANTNLEILAIENALLNPPFDTNITHYNVEVSNEITNLNILAVPENENATIQITGKEELKVGNNLIRVTVAAQNEISNKVYEINVYRRNMDEEKIYKEEQEKNKEKLEEIYKIEKTNSLLEENLEESREKKQNKVIWIISIILGVILLVSILIFKYKFFRNKL